MAIPGMSGASPIEPAAEMRGNAPVESAKTEETFAYDEGKAKKAQAQQKQNAAKKVLANDIQNGNARYNVHLIFDDVDIYVGNMTLREVEKKYNLPQGTLNDEKTDMNGYYATQKPAGGTINVSAKTLASSLGVDTDTLKNMFPESKQTHPLQRAKEIVKEGVRRVKHNLGR